MSGAEERPPRPRPAQPISQEGSSPRKRGLSRGCWIAATAVGAVLLLCGGGFGLLAYSCWQNPDVRRVARAVGEGFTVMQEAMDAPGTEELRRAGCDSALVLTPEQLGRIARAVAPDAGTPDRRELPRHRSVVCQVSRAETITCEQAARTYGDAVQGPPDEFAVAVQGVGGREIFCDGVYTPDGRRIGDLGRREARTMGHLGVDR